MKKTNIVFTTIIALLPLLFGATMQAQTNTTVVSGLRSPQKIIHVPQRKFFLVSEAGIVTTPNSGRVSIVTGEGNRITLLDGLPSGAAPPNNEPSGPSAITVHDNRLYLAIGAGNATLAGPAPASEIPNPNPNSPIFSSVLEFRFPDRFFFGGTGYSLTSADQTRLANGETVLLGSGNQQARVRVVANFPDFTPAPRPDLPTNVRPSNPFGIVLQADRIYVADAGQNLIYTIDRDNGTFQTLILYPARPNPLAPMGPPFIDPVPDSLRLFGNKLLVTFLVGFPFPPAASDVRQYDLQTGFESRLIGGLRSAIDVLPVAGDGFCSSFYTLEFSSNFLAGAPGLLKRFDSPTGPPVVISSTLTSPTSMALDPSNGDILVTEIFPGRVIRVSTQTP